MSDSIELRVPASTANLGPGYGVLGLALDLPFEIRMEERDEPGYVVERPETGAQTALDLRHDAILRGLKAAAERWKIQLPKGLALVTRGDVPRGCGLGSNSADIASGVLAALHYAQKHPSLDEQLSLLVELGGDPAHGAATLCGAPVLAIPVHRPTERPRYIGLPFELHADWRFVIATPDVHVGTAAVHRVLPAQLPNAVTIRTAGRLAGLLEALKSGREDLLALCLVDEVHVPYRMNLAPGMEQAADAARAAGATGVTISGHGPALLAFTKHEDRVEAISAAMVEGFAAHETAAEVVATRVWNPDRATTIRIES